MAQLIDGGAGDVMIFDERIGGFSRTAQVETEWLSACLKTAFDNDPELAKKDETLRKALLKTRENKEPILSFCALAREAGVELYPGELLAVGAEYSDNQCKSTNGGNPTPYDSFNDAYEIFLASVGI